MEVVGSTRSNMFVNWETSQPYPLLKGTPSTDTHTHTLSLYCLIQLIKLAEDILQDGQHNSGHIFRSLHSWCAVWWVLCAHAYVWAVAQVFCTRCKRNQVLWMFKVHQTFRRRRATLVLKFMTMTHTFSEGKDGLYITFRFVFLKAGSWFVLSSWGHCACVY